VITRNNTSRSANSNAPLSWCRRNIHFLIAATILGVTALGWRLAIAKLGIVLQKQPVPWPAPAEVSEDFRLLSLPKEIGPYVMVEEDGLLDRQPNGQPKYDNLPDGENVFRKEDRELLGIGTGLDEKRLESRCSNWYVSRIYLDTRVTDPMNPYKYWHLAVYYYTGGEDKVPHISEVCLVAGGASPQEPSDVTFHVPSAPSGWDESIKLRRVPYVVADPVSGVENRFVQYYTFSLNGRPEEDRNRVRLTLTYPWVKYCYFAKIEFAPRGVITNMDEADRAGEDFFKNYLPTVLRFLPMPDAIDRLDSKDITQGAPED